MDFTSIVGIGIAHWLGDFVFQSRKVAEGKSKSFRILGQHVALYTATLAAVMVPVITQHHSLKSAIAYVLINGFMHFIIDATTSKATTYYWGKDEKSNFWNTVGLDQTLHWMHLLITYMGFFVWK
jgi:hypothetical protein